MVAETKGLTSEIYSFFSEPHIIYSLFLLVIAFVGAYLLSKIVALLIIKLARVIARLSDNSPDAEVQIKLRRLETYLSVLIAVVRVLIIGFVAFYAWKVISPTATTGVATIGASAFFVVLASGTIGMILRDITSGSAMIAESWFNVGDFIDVEPFTKLSGIVERMTLRSTKIRNINGEVIWIHNQHIQAVRVTPNGLRRIAVDVFVNNQKVGKSIISKAISTMPVGTIKVAKKPEIIIEEKWGDYLWHFVVVAETAPGREWLMEDFFISSLKELDKQRKGIQTLIRPPIARFADPEAEKSFKRAIKTKK